MLYYRIVVWTGSNDVILTSQVVNILPSRVSVFSQTRLAITDIFHFDNTDLWISLISSKQRLIVFGCG